MADEKKTFNLIIKATAKGVVEVTRGISADFKRGSAAMKAFNKVAGNGKKAVNRLTGELKALVATMISYQGAVRAVGMMSGFEQKFAEVGTLTNASAVSLGKLRDEIINISREVPQSATQLTAAEYDILSAGVALKDSAGVLKLAAKAAIAGVTDTRTAANVGVSVLNAYGLSVAELGRVYDVLFQTVKDGQTTFPELAAHIGKILPIARSAGVELNAVSAALGAMTKSGMNTEIATTALRGAIAALASPAGAAKVKMEELGISWNGLEGTIKQIADKKLGAEVLRQIIPDINARTAVSSLALNYQTLDTNLKNLHNSAGATEAAFDKMVGTLSNRWQLIKNAIAAAVLQNGDFKRSLDEILGQLRQLAPEIGKLITKIITFTSKVALLLVKHKNWVIALLGAGGLVFAIGKLVTIVKAAKIAVDAFKAAGLAMGLTEAGTAAAGAATAVGGLPSVITPIVTAVGGWVSGLGELVTGLGVAGTAGAAFGVIAATLAVVQIAKAIKAVYGWIQAERELKQVTDELASRQDALIAKTEKFASFRLEPGMLNAPLEELKQLENKLLHTATYWKTELSRLKQQAAETNWFGNPTEQAKEAQAAIAETYQRWQQAEGELEQVQTVLKANTEGLKQAQEDSAAAMDKQTKGMGKQATAADKLKASLSTLKDQTALVDSSYRLMLSNLKLSLARGEITEKEYRQKRLAAEKAHWEKIVELRQAAVDEMAAAGKKGTREYINALADLREAENHVVTTSEKMKEALKKAGDKGKEAGEKAKDVWQALADQLGTTVEALKAALREITGEIETASDKIDGLRSNNGRNVTDWNDGGGKFAWNLNYDKIFHDALNATKEGAAAMEKKYRQAAAGGLGSSNNYYRAIGRANEKAASQIKLITDALNSGYISDALKAKLTESELSALKDRLSKNTDALNANTEALTAKHVPGYATGGTVPGIGSRDTVPALLTPGEYVIKKSIVSRLGRGFFDAINNGVARMPTIRLPQLPVQKFAAGGQVEPQKTITLDFRLGGRSHQGVFAPDVAESLINSLRQASMVSA